jgi:hypothetical protein
MEDMPVMRRTRMFRPEPACALEERVALSHAAVASVVSEAQGRLAFVTRGAFATVLPNEPGSADKMTLVGGRTLPGLGILRLSGTLSSNPSLPPSVSKTNGTLVLSIRTRAQSGTVTLSISGPEANLAPAFPQTDHFTYTVTGTTGNTSPPLGLTGPFDITLATKGRPQHGVARGLFTAVLSER